MSLAIKFGDSNDPSSVSGAIYFDAVTDYRRTYSGKVTEHPIEAGASITDHFVSENPKIRVSGVISSVDFSFIPSVVMLDGEPILNSNPTPQAVMVGGWGSKLKELIPSNISQFLPTVRPTVTLDQSGRTDHKQSIELMMRELLNGLYLDQERQRWENRMTPTTLFEVVGMDAVVVLDNLIVTKFEIDESVENGDALFFDMDMEQVRFVTLEKAEAPKAAKNTPVGRSSTPEKNKGNVPSTPRNTASRAAPGEPTVITNIGIAGRPWGTP